MSGLHPLVYAAVFLGALTLTWLTTPIASRVAVRYGVVDRPGGYKAQAQPIPYLGGIVIVAVFSIALVAAASIVDSILLDQLGVILATGIGLSVMGLADDLWGLSAYVRLVGEITAGLVVVMSGAGVALFPGGPLNVVLTVLWIVGVANAFNLLDNMDGLSSGVAAIASASFFIIAALQGQMLVAALACALAGCALGFLRHNFHPARIYMGDAGSLYIGFLLAVIGLKLRFEAPPEVTFFVPILVLGVPLFDTVLVVITRLAHGRNPLLGGRDHVSHRLVFIGLQVRVAVCLIFAGAVALGWLALLMTLLDKPAAFVLMAFALAIAGFFGVLLGRVPVYDSSKRKHHRFQEIPPPAPGIQG